MMKKIKALSLVCVMLLSGCFAQIEDVVETAETADTAQAHSVTAAVAEEQVQAPAQRPYSFQPKMYCDYEAEQVENPKYADYIRTVDDNLTEYEFQGAVLVALRDEIILAKGYGYADEKQGSLCTARDTFEIGSVSKQMTAAMILQLAEQGRLSLNDTLYKYFPEYRHGRKITIKNLLQMRSGLYDYLNDVDYFFPEDFAEEFRERADAPDESSADFPRDFLLEYLYKSPHEGKPDDHFYYCNTNYYLLGLIIEQVTGMSFQDYMQQQIFDPCGMKTANNGFRDTTARGYYEDGTTLSMRTSTSLGCGSVNAGVYDLYQWYMNLFNYDIIENHTLRAMLTPVDGYGFGIRYDNGYAYHVGNTDVFNAYTLVHVQDELYIIVLTNSPVTERSAALYTDYLLETYKDFYWD